MLLAPPCRQPFGDATALELQGFSTATSISPPDHTDTTVIAAPPPHSSGARRPVATFNSLSRRVSPDSSAGDDNCDGVCSMTNRDLPNRCDHLDAVRRHARVVGRDAAHLDDLVQECLMRALSRPHVWRDVRNARGYLLTILRNVHVDDTARRWRDNGTVSVEQTSSESASLPEQFGPLLLRDLVRALLMLPERRRRVVLLTALDGMSYQEVADLLDVPIGTVMSRLSRARDSLRELMDEEGDPMTGMDEPSGRRGFARAHSSRRANMVGAE
jgi:RNA polymerase sigma-70 factor, ECF subfamily